MTKSEVIALQQDLHRLGFYAGPIDGIYGPNTERALWARAWAVLAVWIAAFLTASYLHSQ